MKKTRIGIIGLGGIAKSVHVPTYKDMEQVEVVALCDIIKQRADDIKSNYFPNANVYTDYKKLFKQENLDAVDICTPNYLHSEIAVLAMKNDIHVFCEKPDAMTVDEVLEMQKTSVEFNKTLMVMRNNRFYNTSKYIKQYIKSGHAGEIYAGRCGWQRRRGIPGKGGWFTTKSKSGGGPLIDLGVHMIDLAIWLMGNPKPVSVSGSTFCKFAHDNVESDSKHAQFGDTKSDGTFDVEDLAMGFIKFDNDACLQIEFSWASNIEQETNFVELRGTKAGINWFNNGNIKIFAEQDGMLVDINPQYGEITGGHGANIQHFIDVIRNKTKPKFVPQQGVNMIKILNAIYESANTGKEVLL